MGSCMDPPKLAIVTGFCRGNSLYNYIRANKNQTTSINVAKIIAQHIVQVTNVHFFVKQYVYALLNAYLALTLQTNNS